MRIGSLSRNLVQSAGGVSLIVLHALQPLRVGVPFGEHRSIDTHNQGVMFGEASVPFSEPASIKISGLAELSRGIW